MAFAHRYAPDAAAGVIDFEGFAMFRGPHLDGLNAEGKEFPLSVRQSVRDWGTLFSDLNQWMLKVLLAPFVPFSAERVHRALGYEYPLFGAQQIVTYAERERTHEALVYDPTQAMGHWAPSAMTPGQRLEPPKPLYKKLEETVVGVELHS